MTEPSTSSHAAPLTCWWPACPEPPTGESGYCERHRELSEAEAQVVMRQVTMERLLAMKAMARKMVNQERRARWRKNDGLDKSRRRLAKASRRKQR